MPRRAPPIGAWISALAPLALSLADVEQFALTDLASRRALLLIVEHRPLLDAFADTLLDQEVLLREDIERIVAREARPLEDVVEPPVPEVGASSHCHRRAATSTPIGNRARIHSPPVFGRIDHVGVAVDDLEATMELYRDHFRMREQHREMVEDFGVEAVLFEVGESHVELLRPLSEDTGVGRFLERNGPGMHHVAYGTDDIDAALDAVRSAGIRLLDEEPRRGIRDSRVAFLHPKATGGVLTELVEAAHA
jgi:methylmalonyl-CoA/ethylmalonyl-CoA epimerase